MSLMQHRKLYLVAKNSTSPEILTRLACSHYPLVAHQAAANKNLPPEMLKILVESKSVHVLSGVAKNPKLPKGLLFLTLNRLTHSKGQFPDSKHVKEIITVQTSAIPTQFLSLFLEKYPELFNHITKHIPSLDEEFLQEWQAEF